MTSVPPFFTPKNKSSNRQIRASSLPVIISVVILFAAASFIFLTEQDDVITGLLAYVFAAVGTALCVAWDSVAQRRGMKNPNFSPNRLQSRFLQILALLGIGVAVIHIIRISEAAAEYLSELWGLV